MRETVWAWLTDPAHDVNGLVAEIDGTLVGFAHYRPFARPLAAASGVFLDDLFVAQAARGSGAADALIDAIKVRAAEQGHSVVRWITAADNARARGLYDKVAQATQWVTYDLTV
jgi:GNAT superfamily N-acetyltransferase